MGTQATRTLRLRCTVKNTQSLNISNEIGSAASEVSLAKMTVGADGGKILSLDCPLQAKPLLAPGARHGARASCLLSKSAGFPSQSGKVSTKFNSQGGNDVAPTTAE